MKYKIKVVVLMKYRIEVVVLRDGVPPGSERIVVVRSARTSVEAAKLVLEELRAKGFNCSVVSVEEASDEGV